MEDVISIAAVDLVGSAGARNGVVSLLAIDVIIARGKAIAFDVIVVGTAENRIIAGATIDRILACFSIDVVAPRVHHQPRRRRISCHSPHHRKGHRTRHRL